MSDSESLVAGTYLIKSKSTGELVGRNIREDKSLLPKSIVLLPKSISAENAQWEITPGNDHTFILRTRGSHATDINHLLFGVLLPNPPATEWKIVRVPQSGAHIYNIIKAGTGEGWVSPAKEHEQIHVRTLIIGPSDPPHHPPNQLFEITRYHHV